MPYIRPEDRNKYDGTIELLIQALIGKKVIAPIGEINYVITRFIHRIIEETEVRYSVLNSLIGVLECAKLELYRQIAAPYEREKHKLNDPVSELDKNGE